MNNVDSPSNEIDLSLIIPLLNEENNIECLTNTIIEETNKLNIKYEIILVDDGSTDNTWAIIKKMTQYHSFLKGISLSRNFGPQNAMFSGLCYSSGAAVITMDGDMQHPPEKIANLYHEWKKGYKIVDTTRIDSEDFSFLKRFSSTLFNKIFSFLSGLSMAKGTSDFRLLDRSVVKIVKEMKDFELFLRGITHWVGFRRTTISYIANERLSGKTKFNFIKLLKYSFNAILSFSLKPLKIGLWLGITTSFLAFIELVYIFVRYFQGKTIEGWASTLTIISFMFGILFILLGIIGAYLGSIFEMLKERPRYITSDTVGFENENNEE